MTKPSIAAADRSRLPNVNGTTFHVMVAVAPGATDASGQLTTIPEPPPPPSLLQTAPVELVIAPCSCEPIGTGGAHGRGSCPYYCRWSSLV